VLAETSIGVHAACQPWPWMLWRSGARFLAKVTGRPSKTKRPSRMRLEYGTSGKAEAS
jgi:hypothetical protein